MPSPNPIIDPDEIARRIDHTLLKAEATAEQIDRLCAEARQYGFATVCVNPVYIRRVSQALAGSTVKTCAVIGFPLGAGTPLSKAREAADAIEQGADELDIVAHLPALVAADYEAIHGELVEIVTAAQHTRTDVVLKVIVESALLMEGVAPDEAERRIATACKAIHDAGGDYIKTSTGFHPAGGATEDSVRLMHQHARAGGTRGRELKVKASGGIRTRDDALRLIGAGADRLGCSSSVQIVRGASQ